MCQGGDYLQCVRVMGGLSRGFNGISHKQLVLTISLVSLDITQSMPLVDTDVTDKLHPHTGIDQASYASCP